LTWASLEKAPPQDRPGSRGYDTVCNAPQSGRVYRVVKEGRLRQQFFIVTTRYVRAKIRIHAQESVDFLHQTKRIRRKLLVKVPANLAFGKRVQESFDACRDFAGFQHHAAPFGKTSFAFATNDVGETGAKPAI